MSTEYVILLLGIFIGTVSASGLNATCVTKCGINCCTETEECSYHSLTGHTCKPKGKMVYCEDGLSYCMEPTTCCGVMSCCPSNTKCCGLNTCCAKGAVCCGMSTCCPAGSTCCGFSTCCSRGSRCVNGYCRAPWSSSMRWYYFVAVLIPFMFVLLYLAKRRQMRLAQQHGQLIRFGATTTTRRQQDAVVAPLSPPVSGYDPAPTMFEPPPYSEIAQLPPEFIPNPQEKPPAYSELYSDSTAVDSSVTNTANDTGNQTEMQDRVNDSVENSAGNQADQQSQSQNTTQSNTGVRNI